MGLNLALMKENGLQHYEKLAAQKSKMLYDFIDNSDGFYLNDVDAKYRSRINIPFRIRNGEKKIEDEFLKEAEQFGILGLKEDSSVADGIRVSFSNALPLECVSALLGFMKKFWLDS